MPSFEKRSSGWSVRFRQIINGDEKNIRLSGFKTKAEALAAYSEEIKKAAAKTAEPLTFGELAEKYLAYAAMSIKPQSLYETRSRLKNHILPEFAAVPVADITAVRLAEWQSAKVSVYTYKFVIALRAAFGAVLRYGSDFYDLPNNLPKVKAPRDFSLADENALHIWTPEQFEQFRAAVSDDLLLLLFDLLYYSGMRKGEALALSAADINGDVITINKTLTRKGGEAWAVSTPKTKGSIRRVRVPPSLSDRLRGHTGRFIFGGDAPIGDRTVERNFKAYIEAAEVPPIHIHDLRHSHASLLISQGCSIVAVSKRLGHANVTQTLNTYSHLLPEDDEKIAEVLGTVLGTKL